jgi:HNH endonuclease
MARARDIDIPVAVLRERLSYDPKTGVLTWTGKSHFTGIEAGTLRPNGYRALDIIIEGKRRAILCHRAAFAIFHGRWPLAELDHVNGDPADNRLANLREATHAENAQNKKKRPSRSGIRGVYRDGAQWIAVIGLNNKRIHLGFFATPKQAHDAYLSARQALFTFQPEPRQ